MKKRRKIIKKKLQISNRDINGTTDMLMFKRKKKKTYKLEYQNDRTLRSPAS